MATKQPKKINRTKKPNKPKRRINLISTLVLLKWVFIVLGFAVLGLVILIIVLMIFVWPRLDKQRIDKQTEAAHQEVASSRSSMEKIADQDLEKVENFIKKPGISSQQIASSKVDICYI